jgi:mono/diheme cytochrome c family protein
VISAFNSGWSNPDIRSLMEKVSSSILQATKRAGVNRIIFVGGTDDEDFFNFSMSYNKSSPRGYTSEESQTILRISWRWSLKVFISSLLSFILFSSPLMASAQKEKSKNPFLSEPLGTTQHAEKVNQQAYGAGQWKGPEQIYGVFCIQCHGSAAVGPELLGRGLPAVATKIMVRHGVATMPPFFVTEINDSELEALAEWIQHSPTPKKGAQ